MVCDIYGHVARNVDADCGLPLGVVGSGGGSLGGSHRRGNSRGGDQDWEGQKGCCIIL